MRTIIMLGIAACAVVAADRAAAAELRLNDGISLSDTMVASGHKKRDTRLDYGIAAPGDARVYSGGADRYPVEGEYRRVDDVDYQGRWTGTWDGTYETEDGRSYEGQYHGTYDGGTGTTYSADPYQQGYQSGVEQRYGQQGDYGRGYDPRHDAHMARLCRDNGAGGGAIGAIAGGIAGNRIAGRGDRLAGTLIGAGVGGIVGAAIDQGEDRKKCAAWRSMRQRHSQGGYPGGYYPGAHNAPTPYPYPGPQHGTVHHQGGYGYYSPGVIVTTIITQPAAPVITETVTTTTTSYETVYTARSRHVPKKRHYKPRPKPRCGC